MWSLRPDESLSVRRDPSVVHKVFNVLTMIFLPLSLLLFLSLFLLGEG